jgi:hypothetical protein
VATWVVLFVAWAWAAEPQTVVVPTSLPAGVTAAPTTRELTKPVPAGVSFVVEGKPTARDGLLVFRGALVNTSTRTVVVHLASVPGSGGPFRLAPRGIAFRPDPAGPPPALGSRSPLEVTLPAGARVPYEAALRLERWAWPEGGGDVDIDWTFDFWAAPATGSVAGRLQPSKPTPQGG